jgi:hypothetical protein
MSPLPRREVEHSLTSKGFQSSERDHEYFFLYVDGRKTSIRTKLSHGTEYKTLSDQILSKIKRQLRLEKMNELSEFVNCPMSYAMYVAYLRERDQI